MRISDWSSDVCSSDLQNIDVNRNFTDYGVAYAQDEVYPILFRALCPDDWTEETIDWSAARDQVTRDYGMKRMVTAAGGGQIVEPNGMNYVGTGPPLSRRGVEKLLPPISAASRQIPLSEQLPWSRGKREQ